MTQSDMTPTTPAADGMPQLPEPKNPDSAIWTLIHNWTEAEGSKAQVKAGDLVDAAIKDHAQQHAAALQLEVEGLRAGNAALRDKMEDFDHRLLSWAQAYPLSIFPEPDYKAVHEVLKANGLTLDRVSAGNMRHVATKLNELFEPVRAALANEQPQGE